MIGHQQIITVRRQGSTPKHVFVEVGSHPKIHWKWQDPESQLELGEHAVVHTGKEFPGQHDLRWARGLTLQMTVRDYPEGFDLWWEALQAQQPAAMYAVDGQGDYRTWKPE